VQRHYRRSYRRFTITVALVLRLCIASVFTHYASAADINLSGFRASISLCVCTFPFISPECMQIF